MLVCTRFVPLEWVPVASAACLGGLTINGAARYLVPAGDPVEGDAAAAYGVLPCLDELPGVYNRMRFGVEGDVVFEWGNPRPEIWITSTTTSGFGSSSFILTSSGSRRDRPAGQWSTLNSGLQGYSQLQLAIAGRVIADEPGVVGFELFIPAGAFAPLFTGVTGQSNYAARQVCGVSGSYEEIVVYRMEVRTSVPVFSGPGGATDFDPLVEALRPWFVSGGNTPFLSTVANNTSSLVSQGAALGAAVDYGNSRLDLIANAVVNGTSEVVAEQVQTRAIAEDSRDAIREGLIDPVSGLPRLVMMNNLLDTMLRDPTTERPFLSLLLDEVSAFHDDVNDNLSDVLDELDTLTDDVSAIRSLLANGDDSTFADPATVGSRLGSQVETAADAARTTVEGAAGELFDFGEGEPQLPVDGDGRFTLTLPLVNLGGDYFGFQEDWVDVEVDASQLAFLRDGLHVLVLSLLHLWGVMRVFEEFRRQ